MDVVVVLVLPVSADLQNKNIDNNWQQMLSSLNTCITCIRCPYYLSTCTTVFASPGSVPSEYARNISKTGTIFFNLNLKYAFKNLTTKGQCCNKCVGCCMNICILCFNKGLEIVSLYMYHYMLRHNKICIMRFTFQLQESGIRVSITKITIFFENNKGYKKCKYS